MPDTPGGWDPQVVARLLDALQASGYRSITFEGRGPGQKLRVITGINAVSENELKQAIDNLRA